jgi:hypothetical protein
MKNGNRRKANQRKNRNARQRLVTPQGVKSKKKLRANAFMGPADQKAMRKMVNQAIGAMLIGALDIDFIGIIEQRADDEPKAPETLQ